MFRERRVLRSFTSGGRQARITGFGGRGFERCLIVVMTPVFSVHVFNLLVLHFECRAVLHFV